MGLMGLMGCSSEEERLPALASIEVRGFVAGFEEAYGAYGANGAHGATRAWSPPGGYSLFDEADKSIGIAFTQDGKEPKMGSFFKSSGKWRTSLEKITADTYYLYGYVPYNPGVQFSIADRNDAHATNYSSGAKVTLQKVPAVMSGDLCVVIGAKDGTDAETVTGLRSGDFSYSAQAIGSGDADNYVFLLFDHLYAALRIKMKVHADYDALRTIKLKSLRMKTQAGETTSTTKADILVDLKGTEGESPIQSITYTPSGEAITEPLEFWSSRNGETLTTEFSNYVGHFMPQDITTLILTSVYDVYDKKGNLIRQGCMATNTMELSELFTGQKTTRRGCRYTINMTIRPTYLYMLSEPDLNDPTVTIE